MRCDQPRRRRFDARELTVGVERLLPLVLALVYAAQCAERTGAQPRRLGDFLEQSFRAIEHSRPQIILRERKQRLLAMLGRQLIPREQVLMNADGALDLAAPAIQRAEREMRLDRVRARVEKLQKHVERAVGLLGHEIVQPGEIVRMELAEAAGVDAPQTPAAGPSFAPAEMAGEDAEHQCRQYQQPGD